MAKIRFFPLAEAPTLSSLCDWTGAKLGEGADPDLRVFDVAPLDAAGAGDLTFLDNAKYASQFAATRAAAAFVSQKFAARAPKGCATLIVAQPYRAMAETMIRLFPSAARPQSGFGESRVSARAHIHVDAKLEPGVVVDPGAVIGPRAHIGARTVIGANAVVGPDVRIGRDVSIGPSATVLCALIGDRVIIHPGARIGQDGFGFALGAKGHLKVPQVGRVIIQDQVEIGANSAIDRGANRDTIIGEGCKIDNLVQVGHNVVMGRHCVLVSQSGVSGSCVLEDFVALGGQAGLAGHLHVGAGAQIAASAGVMNDVPAGETWGGAPAQPLREFFREVAAVKKLTRARSVAREAGAD